LALFSITIGIFCIVVYSRRQWHIQHMLSHYLRNFLSHAAYEMVCASTLSASYMLKTPMAVTASEETVKNSVSLMVNTKNDASAACASSFVSRLPTAEVWSRPNLRCRRPERETQTWPGNRDRHRRTGKGSGFLGASCCKLRCSARRLAARDRWSLVRSGSRSVSNYCFSGWNSLYVRAIFISCILFYVSYQPFIASIPRVTILENWLSILNMVPF